MITREEIVLWLQRLGEVCEENRELLTQLDAAIGDANHGINMERRFNKVAAAEGAAGRESLDAPAFAAILRSGVEALKAQLGDKTMINTLDPDVHALENGAGEGRNPGEILRSAVRAAEQGMKATIPLVAKKGRASYLNERSAGHHDPGPTSAYRMFEALGDTVC